MDLRLYIYVKGKIREEGRYNIFLNLMVLRNTTFRFPVSAPTCKSLEVVTTILIIKEKQKSGIN